MSTKAADVFTIFWALDNGRKQQLADEAQWLMDEQNDEAMHVDFAAGVAAGRAAVH